MTSLDKYHSEGSDKSKSEERSEMELLLERLPVLNDYFQLHSKIGQGTFSTVYLATFRNNSSTRKYAVKHLTQTCEESRIQNELRCLQEIGGKDNVVPAELCMTNGKDCVTFIMPYLAHSKFSDYVTDMDAEETCFYMKNLFIALKRVHSFNIIHRDVKPNNFLYNRENKQFLLVDFGLAQLVRTPEEKVKEKPKEKAKDGVDENVAVDCSKKRKRGVDSSDDERKTVQKGSKRVALKSKDSNVRVSTTPKTEVERGKEELSSPVKRAEKPSGEETPVKRVLSGPSGRRRKLLDDGRAEQGNSFTPLVSSKSSTANFLQIRNSRVVRQEAISRGGPSTSSSRASSCLCSGRGAVCSACSSRRPMYAPRAGTSGFRPPEVLFRYLHQTTAVDMWAAGVIMLCILSGCYPFFSSSTDLASLAEIMTIFGTERTIEVAKKFGRRIVCSDHRKGVDLKKLCKRLRARATRRSRSERSSSNEPKCRDCFQAIRKDGCICPSDELTSEDGQEECWEGPRFPDSAFDLLQRLLDLDPTTRITAADALEHPFIVGNHHVSNKGLQWRGSSESRCARNGRVLAGAPPGDVCDADEASEVAVPGGDQLEGADSVKDDAVHLKRRLGLFSGVALIVGTMIGSGIFVSPSGLLIRTGSVGMSFVIWVACGVLSLLGALAYAELGTMNTSSGAEYAYFMDAFGPMPAFLFSWVSTLVLKPSQMAIICLSFAKYAVEAFVAECDPPDAAVKAVSVLAIVVILFINCYSVNLATGVQNVFTAAKLVAILIVILGGMYKLIQGNTQHLENVFHGSTFSFGNIATAFYTGLWAYDGWNNLNYVTEEIKNPSKNLPRSIVIAIPLVTICYVLINVSYLAVMSAAEMVESEAVAVTFGNRILGVMAWLIPLSVTVSTFGSANGTLFAAGRLCFAASREGHLMDILSYVHIRRFTPAPGLIFHSLIAAAMVLSGTIDSLIDFFSFTAWIFYGGAMLALIVMRFTKPDYPRPYKVPIIIPVVVLVISLYLIVAPIIDVPQIEYLYAAFFIVGGLVFYVPFVYYGIHWKVMDRFTVFCQLLLEVAPTQVMFDST